MSQTNNFKSYGSIRKYKRYGTCGVILGMAAVTLAMNSGTALADETSTTTPKTEVVSKPDANNTEKATNKESDLSKVDNSKVDNKEVKPQDNAKDSNKQNQVDEFASLEKENAELNKDLAKVVQEAKSLGITVKMDKDVEYKTTEEAKKDVQEQIKKLEQLNSLIKEKRAQLNSLIEQAKAKGVRFEGTTNIDLTDGNTEAFNKKVSDAENKVSEAVKTQDMLNSETAKATKEAESKGLTVKVQGEEVVSPEGAQDALNKFKTKLSDAIKLKESVEKENAKITEENKNAKATLTKDSTAKSNSDGSYTQTLVGKSEVNHTEDKKVAHKPMDLLALMDFSSSFQGKRPEALKMLKSLIQNDLTDEDGVMLQGYIYNKRESYTAHGAQLDFAKLRNEDWETGFSTKILTKQEAISVIDKWLAVVPPNTPNGVATYTDYFNAIARAMGDFGYKTDEVDSNKSVKKIPFEDVYTSQNNKKGLVSVVQFTDGWSDREEMDPTFADWAKKNAKTFMSVVNRNKVTNEDNNDPNSVESMKKLGHPNIYDTTGKSADVVTNEVLEQFKNTATEISKSVQDTKSKGIITLTPDASVTLVSATLVSPSGTKQNLEIKDNKVSYTGDLTEKGDYKVEYTFKSNKNEKGQVVGKFDVETETQEITQTTKKEQVPMDLLAVLDFSSSTSKNARKEKGYTGTPLREKQIASLRSLINNDLTDKDQISFALYGTNREDSYNIGVYGAGMTPLMNKADANKFLDSILNDTDLMESSWHTGMQGLGGKAPEAKDGMGFEDVYKAFKNKNKIVSVIQYTDSWLDYETIDTSFAKWAKENAKTFMSVITNDGYDNEGVAEAKMKQAGHPNVVSSDISQSEIENTFRNTAVEMTDTVVTPKKSTTSDSKTDKFEPVKLKDLKKAPTTVEVSKLIVKTETPVINKVETNAHRVTVAKPVEQKPVEQKVEKKDTPVTKTLPKTGSSESASLFSLIGMSLLGVLSLVGFSKKKEN